MWRLIKMTFFFPLLKFTLGLEHLTHKEAVDCAALVFY